MISLSREGGFPYLPLMSRKVAERRRADWLLDHVVQVPMLLYRPRGLTREVRLQRGFPETVDWIVDSRNGATCPDGWDEDRFGDHHDLASGLSTQAVRDSLGLLAFTVHEGKPHEFYLIMQPADLEYWGRELGFPALNDLSITDIPTRHVGSRWRRLPIVTAEALAHMVLYYLAMGVAIILAAGLVLIGPFYLIWKWIRGRRGGEAAAPGDSGDPGETGDAGASPADRSPEPE